MISRAVPRCNRQQAVTAQPHPVRSPVATGGGRGLATMSQPMEQRYVHDPVPRSSLGRCPSPPGAIDPQNAHAADGSRSKGFGGRRRAPRSCGDIVPGLINDPLKHFMSFLSNQVVFPPAIGQPLAIGRSLRPSQCRINTESSLHRLGHTAEQPELLVPADQVQKWVEWYPL